MILWLVAMSMAMIALLGASIPVWLLAFSWTALAWSTIYYTANMVELIPKQEQIHFKDKIEARDSIWNKQWYLKEDKLF